MENKEILQTGIQNGGSPQWARTSSFDVVAPNVAAAPQNPLGGGIAQVMQPDPAPAGPAPEPIAPATPKPITQSFTARRRSMALWQKFALGSLGVATIAGGIFIFSRGSDQVSTVQSGDFATTQVPLGTFASEDSPVIAGAQVVTVNGKLAINDSLVLKPTTQPENAVMGQLYYNQDANSLAYFNGTEFLNLVASSTIIQNTTTVNNFIASAGGVAATNASVNKIPKFNSSLNLTDSIITDNTTNVAIAGNLNLATPTTAPSPDLTLWTPTTIPTTEADTGDDEAVELGVKFRTDVSGFIKGVRFYKGATNTGTHVGNLWTSGGSLLARATFTSETATGWQEVRFSTPVAVTADATYVASYHAPVGNYAHDAHFFATDGAHSGSLHALASGIDGGNGLFKYSNTTIFPTETFNSTNYWVDVIFAPNPPPAQYQINGVQMASSDLGNNADLAKRSASQVFTGSNTFRTAADSASAFSIQSAIGNALFTADSANGRVYIGKPGGSIIGIVLVLGNKNTSGDPLGVDGGMYYNSAQQMLRCYRNGLWEACANLEVDQGYSQYEEFMGGQASSFASPIGSLGWNAHAIGANGTVAYNPSTPTPVADRPGVLHLQTPALANQGTTLSLAESGAHSMILQSGTSFKTSVAVGAATNHVLRVGLHPQTTTTTQPLSGVWWEANPAVSPLWRMCYGDGTSAICNPSSVAIAANTWVRLEARVTATGLGTSSITYYVNGSPTSFVTTTVDSTTRVSPALSFYTTNGAAQNCYWDYFQLKGTTTAQR
jgi:hypothetical protein